MRRFYSLKLKAGGDAFTAGQIIGQNPDLMPRLGDLESDPKRRGLSAGMRD
jgi:hypothetical protein